MTTLTRLLLSAIAGLSTQTYSFADGPAPSAQGEKWALLVGVDKCAAVGELKVCAADALALGAVLEQIGYSAGHITVLVDNQSNVNTLPTIGNVERAVRRLAQIAEPNDTVLFFFSGHGVTSGGGSYIVPTDGDLTKGVSLSWVKDQFAASKAKEKIVLLDACHSGAAKGVSGIAPDLKAAGGNLVMLLSCERDQVSWPDALDQHSVFTSAILDGLCGKAAGTDRKVTHRSLAAYVRKSVRDWTYANQKTEQTPVLVADAGADIVLADLACMSPVRVSPKEPAPRVDTAQHQPETTEGLLAAGRFAEAASKIDARTDLAWRTCAEHLDQLQSAIAGIGASQAPSETECAALHTAIRDLAGDCCLWYEQPPHEWQLACAKACAKLRNALSASLERLPEGDATTYVRLVNDLRAFGAVVTAQDERPLPGKVTARYATHAGTLRKMQPALVPADDGEAWIDDVSKRPFCVRPKTDAKALNGMTFMYVPEGPVLIGTIDPAASKRTQVTLSGYYIAKWEVTVAQYRAFCEELNRDLPEGAANPDSAQLPVTSVRHREASEFCDWLKRKLAAGGWRGECRLPSECEMEKAARGSSCYQYAWGYKFDERSCLNAVTSPGKPQPTDSAGADVSFWGVANLAGNVSEWCCDDWVPNLTAIVSPKARNLIVRQEGDDGVRFKVLKGGNFTCREASRLEIAARSQEAPASAARHIGFRVVLLPAE